MDERDRLPDTYKFAPVSRAYRGRGALRGLVLLFGAAAGLIAADPAPVPTTGTTLAQLVVAIRAKAKTLESSGVKAGYQAFKSTFKLQAGTVSLSDYSVARVLFEATRDAGLWNLHWVITDLPPNSDSIWRQWKSVHAPSAVAATGVAECDELSALYAFLMARAEIRGVGLLWPYPNHTVAVWTVRPAAGPVRVVIPTTQIFLEDSDYWGTKKFDPWRQKVIYDYGRRDVADSFEIPQRLFAFFLQQVDKYGGASDSTLQLLRYYREAVLTKSWTPEVAGREALRVLRGRGSDAAENLAALQSFADDMRAGIK